MWSYLTGRDAAINYSFVDMAIEVPRDTGAEARRATWKPTARCASPPATTLPEMPQRDGRRSLRVQADLQLDVSPSGDDGGPALGMAIRSESDVVNVRLDRVPDLATRPSTERIRTVAAGLIGQGLRVVVEGPDGRLVSVGAGVRTPWWQRPFVRAPHVRCAACERRCGRCRGGVEEAVQRGSAHRRCCSPHRRRCCRWRPPASPATHLDHPRPGRGRGPATVFPAADSAGARLKVFYLQPVVSVGDREDADLRLPGVAARQATIRRDARDEYVIEPEPDGVPIRVHGSRILRPTQLRTGARIEMGPWTMVYFRAEYADHGRPYGGRQVARSTSSSGSRPDATARRSARDDPGGRPAADVSRRSRSAGCHGHRIRVRPARSIRHQEMNPITQNTP